MLCARVHGSLDPVSKAVHLLVNQAGVNKKFKKTQITRETLSPSKADFERKKELY